MHKKRIIHVITGLNMGGAEMMLYKLLTATDYRVFEPIVISLLDKGVIGPRIEKLSVPVYSLGMTQGRLVTSAGFALSNLLRELRPDIIQGWMYHANLASTVAASIASRNAAVIWNIRQSLYNLKAEKKTTTAVIYLSAWLSRFPRQIIYNAAISAQQHEQLGFRADKRRVISNGFDCERFQPSSTAHQQLCQMLDISGDCILIGLVGRYHDMKDHPNFVQAAKLVNLQYTQAHFVLIGTNITADNDALCSLIKDAKLEHKIHLLGERSDIPTLMPGLDILVNSSWAEAFPNVIGEGMACAVPCVVTDVGESAMIVGNTGKVVPPRDADMLAGAIIDLLDAGSSHRQQLGQLARQRIVDKYSLPQVVAQYESLYTNVLVG